MNVQNISKVVKNLTLAAKKHSPEILTGIGIAGMITTVILAVKATPKALDLIVEVKEKHEEDTDKKEYCKDVLTKVAPVYIPTTIVGGLSIACLIGASSVNHKRNAALATAYALSESALREYKDKVVETFGEKKEKTVRASIAKDKLEQNPVADREIVVTGKGTTRCLDVLSGRYFESSVNELERARNEINNMMLNYDYVSLNEFYDEIGLKHTKLGDDLGWHIDQGYVALEFDTQLDADGVPCLVLDYKLAPRYHYDRVS